MSKKKDGAVLWFTGLSGAGKSTLANALAPELSALGKRVEILDGDVVRTQLSKGLGFSREGRDEHVTRLAFVAHLLARNGVTVLVAAISPFRRTRERARALIQDFVEIHVAPPLAECVKRDVKGLYKRAIAGEIPQFTGISDPYEAPISPELALDTSTISVDEGVDRVLAKLRDLGYLEGGVTTQSTAPSSESKNQNGRWWRRAMGEQVFLPRFSDKRDIDEFVDKLAAFERGELNAEQFRAFRLLRGVYGQRQPDVQMFRIKIPYGLLGPDQLIAIAQIADEYSRGFGHVTTRQNIQLHFMKMSDMEVVMRRLDEVGITTREACGNSVRTVTACELAEVCADAPFDVTPYAHAITEHFLRGPRSSSLPRKFKIAFSGCGSDCALGAIHDIGFVAQVRDGQRGFKVYAAGGLSTTPQAAIALHDFVPAGEIGRVGEALLRLFHALGNRDNKHRARLKYVLRKLGEEGFRAKYAEFRAAVDAEAAAELRLPEHPRNRPAAPVLDGAAPQPPGYMAWRSGSVVDQRQDGYAAVYVRLFLGDITSAQMRALAAIAPRFGDGTVRLTIDQNIVLPWVDRQSLPALYIALRENDLARTDVHTAKDVLSCPGAESCNLAVTSSRNVARAIAERLELPDVAGNRAMADTTIKISGCPNSCGQHHVADIGWHGAAKTVNGTTYPMYQLHLGGGVDENGARFGRQVVKVVARRVPDAVAALLKLFEAERKDGETPAEFYLRVDPKRVVAVLGDIASGAPVAAEQNDVGEESGFEVAIGVGECAA